MSRAKVLEYCDFKGIELDQDFGRSSKRATFWSPLGQVFAVSGTHCLVIHWHSGPAAEFWQTCLDDLAAGMLPCDDHECEHCHEEVE